MVYDVWFMVYGVWCMVFVQDLAKYCGGSLNDLIIDRVFTGRFVGWDGVWCMGCGVWGVVYGVWRVLLVVWYVLCVWFGMYCMCMVWYVCRLVWCVYVSVPSGWPQGSPEG